MRTLTKRNGTSISPRRSVSHQRRRRRNERKKRKGEKRAEERRKKSRRKKKKKAYILGNIKIRIFELSIRKTMTKRKEGLNILFIKPSITNK